MTSNDQLDNALRILSDRRNRAKAVASARKQELYQHLPRLREIEQALAGTGPELVRAVMTDRSESGAAVAAVRARNQALQGERGVLLLEAGVDEHFLEPVYACPACRDEGYVNGKKCACLEKLLREEKLKRLNASSSLSLSRFESFRVDYYSSAPDASGNTPRRRMEEILGVCRQYAAAFSPGKSPNLLMMGATGLGKTHLSLAIASEVIGKGFEVVYGSVQDLFRQAETERFARDSSTNALDGLLGCDLLILDDLGSEFSTSFTVATLYNLVNTRINRGRPTIISTNLLIKELKTQYPDRIVSRLIGSYATLQFLGTDIRVRAARQ